MDGTCRKHGEMRDANIILVGYRSEEKSHLGDAGVNARTVLKSALKIYDMML
jgi:hypothetical protein